MASLLDIGSLKVYSFAQHSESIVTNYPLHTLNVCYSSQNSWGELIVHRMKTLLWWTENLHQVF